MPDQRPSNVKRFELLMYMSVATGLITTALNWDRLVAMTKHFGGAVFVVYVDVGVFAVMILLIWLVARRAKNWARWIELGLFVLGSPNGIRLVVHSLIDRPIVGLLELVNTALQIVALFLIFTGDAREWFKRKAVEST